MCACRCECVPKTSRDSLRLRKFVSLIKKKSEICFKRKMHFKNQLKGLRLAFSLRLVCRVASVNSDE